MDLAFEHLRVLLCWVVIYIDLIICCEPVCPWRRLYSTYLQEHYGIPFQAFCIGCRYITGSGGCSGAARRRLISSRCQFADNCVHLVSDVGDSLLSKSVKVFLVIISTLALPLVTTETVSWIFSQKGHFPQKPLLCLRCRLTSVCHQPS